MCNANWYFGDYAFALINSTTFLSFFSLGMCLEPNISNFIIGKKSIDSSDYYTAQIECKIWLLFFHEIKRKIYFLVFIAEFIDKNRLISSWKWNSYPQNEMKKFNIDRLLSLLFRYLHILFFFQFIFSVVVVYILFEIEITWKLEWSKKIISFHIRLLAQLVYFQYDCFARQYFCHSHIEYNVYWIYTIELDHGFYMMKKNQKQFIGSTNWTNH